jgi:hypothetical protein
VSELVVDLRGETGESRRRRQRARAAVFLVLVGALYFLLGDTAAGPSGPAETVVSIDPGVVDFDARPVGDTATREIHIRNSGTTAVLVSRIANASGTLSDFTFESSSCTTIAPQGDCVATVLFKPSRVGPQETSFEVLDGEKRSIGTISVRGTGMRVAAVLELTAPEFPDVILGASSEARPILVQHRGGAPVRILSVAPNDAVGFAIASDSCTGAVLQASTCKVDIVFKPLSRGVVTGSWTITDEEASHEVRMTARGLAKHLAVSQDELIFAPMTVGSGARQFFTVTNDGDVPVAIEGVRAEAPFIVGETSCVKLLAPGDPCQVTIVFHPGKPGEVSGRIVIQGPGGAEEAALTARGAAIERPREPQIGQLKADPPSPIQMTKFDEERTIAITNVGNAPVTIIRVRHPTLTKGSWLSVRDQCSERTLPPTEKCVVTVKVATDNYKFSKEQLVLDTTGTATPTFEIDVLAPGQAPNFNP